MVIPAGLWIGATTTVLGIVSGAFFNTWIQRAEPNITVTGIEFQQAEQAETPILVDADVRELARQSQFVDISDEKVSGAQLREKLQLLDETIIPGLEHTIVFIPKALDILKNPASGAANAEYSDLIAKMSQGSIGESAAASSLTLLTIAAKKMLISGKIRTDDLKINNDDVLQCAEEESKLCSLDKTITLIMMGIDWRPKILQEILTEYGNTFNVAEQLDINRKLSTRLQEIVRTTTQLGNDEFLNLTVTYINAGGQPILLDKYAIMSIDKMPDAIFLAREDKNENVILKAGESTTLELRSARKLTPDVDERLHKLYDTEVVSFVLTSQVLSDNWFVSKWVQSGQISFGAFSAATEDNYKKHATKFKGS